MCHISSYINTLGKKFVYEVSELGEENIVVIPVLLKPPYLRPANLLHLLPSVRLFTPLKPLQLVMRLSGLQKGVLSLYRQCLRETKKKPTVRQLIA